MTPKLLSITSKLPTGNGCTLGVDDLEGGVAHISSGEPACFCFLGRDKSTPRACPLGVARAARVIVITAAAPDVENVLPVPGRRGAEQPRRQPAPRPLLPLRLLDEVPAAGSVPVLGLLHVHRH